MHGPQEVPRRLHPARPVTMLRLRRWDGVDCPQHGLECEVDVAATSPTCTLAQTSVNESTVLVQQPAGLWPKLPQSPVTSESEPMKIRCTSSSRNHRQTV